MADTEEVTADVERIVADRLRVDITAFDDETRFDGEILDAESLDMVEIAEAIEVETDVHIPDADLETLDTVGELTTYVNEHA